MAVTLTRPPSPPAIDEDAPEPYTSEQFRAFAAAYPDLRMERTADGEIIIMPPALTETGRKNFRVSGQLYVWCLQNESGEGFDSSSGFTLPNGAERAPDAAWIKKERWEALTVHQREEEFSPICPDFVVELRSKRDRLSTLQEKMQEYLANGARLGWLVDPRRRKVEIYRTGREVEVLDDPKTVSGDPELPGFVLDLASIWD
jgi:Uma2 family endonuclease